MSKDDDVYKAYCMGKSIIERAKKCCNKDHSQDEHFQYLVSAIETFDSLGRGYAERYEKERKDEQNTV